MRRIYIFIILPVFFIFVFLSLPALAADSFYDGLKKTGGPDGAGYRTGEIEKNPSAFFLRMLGGIMAPVMTGVIGLLILSYGGYIWMMARGNEERVEKAKNIIINTILALIAIYSVYAIVNLIIPYLIIPLWSFVAK